MNKPSRITVAAEHYARGPDNRKLGRVAIALWENKC